MYVIFLRGEFIWLLKIIFFADLMVNLIRIVGTESGGGGLLEVGGQSPEARIGGERLVHGEPGAAQHVAAVRCDS